MREGDGTLAGVATKSSLFAPLPYALILVDHNELQSRTFDSMAAARQWVSETPAS